MRIAIFHNQPGGGARRALHGFAQQLRARHTIDVYTLTTADNVFLRDEDIATRVVRVPYAPRRPIRCGLYLNDVQRHRDFRDLVAVNEQIATLIDAAAYDVVLVDVCRFTLVPPILGQLRTPSVYYAHDPPARSAHEAWRPPRTRWARVRDVWHKPFLDRQARVLAKSQHRSVQHATAVVANSQHTASRLRSAFGVDAVVCPPGVAALEGSDGPRDPKEVLSVGEVEPHKGYPFLVDALALIDPAQRPSLRIIANRANPVERAHLERKAVKADVDLTIDLAVSEEALRDAYARAAVFVFAAHDEPLGLAPLEAMARAAPVVAVAEGGVAETVIDGVTGYLTPRDAGRFANQVRSLLRNDTFRHRLGVNGQENVEEHWNWASRAAALEDVLTHAARRDRVVLE